LSSLTGPAALAGRPADCRETSLRPPLSATEWMVGHRKLSVSSITRPAGGGDSSGVLSPLPICPVDLNLLLASGQHILRRDIANGTVQADVVVMLRRSLEPDAAHRPAKAVFPAGCTRSLAICASARFSRSIGDSKLRFTGLRFRVLPIPALSRRYTSSNPTRGRLPVTGQQQKTTEVAS
jgi:hypothetical protein